MGLLLWALFPLALVAAVLYLIYQRIKPTGHGGPPRVEKGVPLLGAALAYFGSPVKTLEWAHLMYGNVFRLNLLFFDAVFLLRSSLDGGGSLHSTLDKYFYNAEETGEISHHQGVERLRRLAYFHANPSTQIPKANLQKMQEAVATVFRTERMEQYSQRCADIAQRTLDEWTKQAGRDGYIELAAAVQGLVMEINTRLLLGDAFYAAHGRAFAESFLALEKESAHLLARILPDLPFIPPVKRALEARRTLASLIEQELARLRQSKSSDDEGHLLHLLAQVKQEDGSWLPIEQSVDTVLQMFYYGQANTAGHLTWLIAHMSQRGHAQDLHRVRREQRRAMGESEELAYSQFSSFRELEQCIQEVTRLYFTTTLPPRKAIKSFKFEGFTIPEGSLLCVSPILGHLDSDIFPDAGIFFPKRFAPPKKKQAPETKTAFNPSSFYGMAYVQFGYGMHKCPAEKYAMTLLTSFFSVLVRTRSVELKDNKLPLPQYPATFGTATPAGDILIRLQPYAIPRELMFEEDEPEVIRSILPPAH